MTPRLKVVEKEAESSAEKITFDDFWRTYPRRQARKDSLKAWVTIDPMEYPKILRAVALAKRCDQWTRDSGQYIPMPATYLRGERWTDELEIEVSQPAADVRDESCVGVVNGERCSKPGITSHDGKKWYCRQCVTT